MRRLTRAQVRRAAIAAQGLARPRPAGRVDMRHFDRMMDDVGALQIDSVNVVERAHHLTSFSRLGPHDTGLLWRAMQRRHVFEYWGHVASFLPIAQYPLWRHKMAAQEPGRRSRGLMEEEPGYIESVLAQVAERGPLATADLDDPGEAGGPWWGWPKGKVALEWLFATGRVAVAGRRNFTRFYDIPERVIPAQHLAAPKVPRQEAHRRLLLEGASRLVVGTAPDLADYFRLPITEARAALAAMAADGSLAEVEVEGWQEPAFMHPAATIPRRVRARALLCPFDPLVWYRERTERLYDFHYRIEIYVPKPKRVHGYYVFPFLLDDDLCARVDIKADRHEGRLLVPGAFLEEGRDMSRVAGELAVELAEMAGWLGMTEIRVGRKGDLAAELRRAIG